jgi:hypothetical protein
VHYNTFGFIKIDTNDAIDSFKEHDIELILPSIGERIEL